MVGSSGPGFFPALCQDVRGLAVIGGALIFSSITIFSGAFSFWTYDSQFFYRLVKQGTRQMLWYPMNIYSKGIRFALTFVYPLAFVSYYRAGACVPGCSGLGAGT